MLRYVVRARHPSSMAGACGWTRSGAAPFPSGLSRFSSRSGYWGTYRAQRKHCFAGRFGRENTRAGYR